ncbi:MAG: imidazolonepropionase [Phycisphaerales bacterium JB037]
MSGTLVIRHGRVLVMGSTELPARGREMREIGALDGCDVLIEGDRIVAVGRELEAPAGARTIDAAGRVVMPAFVDCHTHACWAGDRLDEWEARLGGASYLDILEAGGGIMSTVRAVRAASEEELTDGLLGRLGRMLREGTATVEVKSGYGLTTGDELKMLRAVRAAGERWAGTVVATACIGHAKDPDQDEFVRTTIEETLPAIHAEFPGIAIDAYCEKGAWSSDETRALLERARELEHPIRLHSDQFHALGMTGWCARNGAVSVDHLEASTEEELEALAGSGTVGVVLPCSGFSVDGRYADGRGLIDRGGALAVATNLNPGSAPCWSMPMAVALAVRMNGISAHEALTACTVNAAAVLGLGDRGRLQAGRRADVIVLGHRDERELAHSFGGNPVDVVVCGGEVVVDAGL